MNFKSNTLESKQRWTAWWNKQSTDRPLLYIPALRNSPLENQYNIAPYDNLEAKYTDAERRTKKQLNYWSKVDPMAEAMPYVNLDLGAGSMALYIGSEPTFAKDTIWFSEFMDDYEKGLPLKFDPNNQWWKKHLEMIDKGIELASDTDAIVTMPDIIENLDILASIRGSQKLCFDFYDHPDKVHEAVDQITELYFKYYDEMYKKIKDTNGASAFTMFSIWGPGRIAKLQCDFAAITSPDQFIEYVIPSLNYQCDRLDNTLFHLDGPECLHHVDALMKIEKLDALQWTPGAAHPYPGDEKWEPLYKQVKDAGKYVWVGLRGDVDKAIADADRLVDRLGAKGFYFLFSEMSQDKANELILHAEKNWKC